MDVGTNSTDPPPVPVNPAPRISVVVVTYNSAKYLRMTLESVFQQEWPDLEVVLLDNASSDESCDIAASFEARGLRIIRSEVNRGFGGGNNDAVRACSGDIVFLVNPDAVMKPGCLDEIARAFNTNPDAGVVGAKLLASDDKTLVHCGGTITLPAHCLLHGYGEQDEGQWDRPFAVDWVAGAALAVRRNVWDQLGGFDEDFFPAYYEDADFCVQANRAGYKVLYWPSAVLTHWENRCGELPETRERSTNFWWMHHTNRLWFTIKFCPSAWLFLTRALPAETRWYFSLHTRGLRLFLLKVYWHTLVKYLRKRCTPHSLPARINH